MPDVVLKEQIQTATQAVAALNKNFEDYKAANDEALSEVKKYGQVTSDTEEKLSKINGRLDEIEGLKKQLEEVETAMNRMAAAPANDDDKDARKHAAQLYSIKTGKVIAPEDVKLDEYRAYTKAFDDYLRKSGDPQGLNLGEETRKALSLATDPEGGFFVAPTMSNRILQKVYETTAMRQICSVISIGTDRVKLSIDNDEADAGWVGERQDRTGTNTPGIGELEIPVHEIYANPKASQTLLDDAQFGVEGWLADKVADKFARIENAAFLTGNGTLKPRGLLSYGTSADADSAGRKWDVLQYIVSGNANTIGAGTAAYDKIIDLIYSLKASYRNNARFLCNRATVGTVRKLKDGDGNYLWQPSAQAGQPSLLAGFGVFEGEDMPGIAADAFPLAFGDFREAYMIVDRIGIRTLRDPFSAKPWVQFYTTKRVGGGLTNGEAVKLLKVSA